jgi:hypothetical protein
MHARCSSVVSRQINNEKPKKEPESFDFRFFNIAIK